MDLGYFTPTITASDGVAQSEVTFQWCVGVELNNPGGNPTSPGFGVLPIGPITPITVSSPPPGPVVLPVGTIAPVTPGNQDSSPLGSSGSATEASSSSGKTTAFKGLPMLIFVQNGPSSWLAALTWSVDSSRTPTYPAALPLVNFLETTVLSLVEILSSLVPWGTPVLRMVLQISRFLTRKILTNWRKIRRDPGRREIRIILPPAVRRMISSR